MDSTYAPYQPMATSRDTPNPLRPYYIPPTIGPDPTRTANINIPSTPREGLGKSARDLLSDLDYGGPLLDRDGPTVAEMAKKILDQAIWKYTSVLLAQPFDVAKTILQVRLAEEDVSSPDTPFGGKQNIRHDDFAPSDDDDDDSDSDSPSYFTPTRPQLARQGGGSPTGKRSKGGNASLSRSESDRPATSAGRAHKLRLKQQDSVMEVLGALWSDSGATGLWKATNSTFVYNVLIKAVESWTRSLLSAVMNLPDPGALSGTPSDLVASAMGGVNVTDSPSPLASLGVAVTAAGIAGILLAPLDLVRTRLIMTPTSLPPRATVQLLRSLPSLFISVSLVPITLLHSLLPPLLTSSTPLILRSQLHVDPITTPTLYSLASFASSTAELFLKLPLETILRRAQVSVLRAQHTNTYNRHHLRSSRSSVLESSHASTATKYGLLDPDLRTIVTPGPYRGIFGTVYAIVFEEGVRRARGSSSVSITNTPVKQGPSSSSTVRRAEKKGQGLSGLWRGWRVGMWGLCGVWLASAANGTGVGGEF